MAPEAMLLRGDLRLEDILALSSFLELTREAFPHDELLVEVC